MFHKVGEGRQGFTQDDSAAAVKPPTVLLVHPTEKSITPTTLPSEFKETWSRSFRQLRLHCAAQRCVPVRRINFPFPKIQKFPTNFPPFCLGLLHFLLPFARPCRTSTPSLSVTRTFSTSTPSQDWLRMIPYHRSPPPPHKKTPNTPLFLV